MSEISNPKIGKKESNMKINRSWKRFSIVLALGFALTSVSTSSSFRDVIAGSTSSVNSIHKAVNTRPVLVSAPAESVHTSSEESAPINQVLEWNQVFIDTLIATNTANSSRS